MIDILITGVIVAIFSYGSFRFIQEIIKDNKAIRDCQRRTAAAIEQMKRYDAEAKAMAEYYQEYTTDPELFAELDELLTKNRIGHD